MMDYSISLIDIAQWKKAAQEACLRKDWESASNCADKILVAALTLKAYSAERSNADNQ